MSKQRSTTTKRFILTQAVLPESIQIGDSYEIDSTEASLLHQLINVFRIEVGDTIILMNKNQTAKNNIEFIFEVTSYYKRAVSLKLLETKTISNELPVQLNLAVSVPNKPAKLEFILEKAVVLGVSNIYLIKTDFSQFAHELRLDRLEKIVIEATEQSERALLPQIHLFPSIKQFLAANSKNLFVALERSEQSLDLLTNDFSDQIIILVGPEGGFSPAERTLLADNKIPHFKLGGSILRMETAVMLSLGVVRLRFS